GRIAWLLPVEVAEGEGEELLAVDERGGGVVVDRRHTREPVQGRRGDTAQFRTEGGGEFDPQRLQAFTPVAPAQQQVDGFTAEIDIGPRPAVTHAHPRSVSSRMPACWATVTVSPGRGTDRTMT